MLLRLSFLGTCLIALMQVLSVFPQSSEHRLTLAFADFGESRIGRLSAETLSASLKSTSVFNVIDRAQTRAAMKGAGYAGSLNMSRARKPAISGQQ